MMKLKCPDYINWLASKKRARYAHPVIAAMLLSLLILIVLSERNHRREQYYESRLTIVKAGLHYLHNASEVVFNERVRYPESFAELRRVCEDRVGKDSCYTKMHVDLTSDMTDEIPEYRE